MGGNVTAPEKSARKGNAYTWHVLALATSIVSNKEIQHDDVGRGVTQGEGDIRRSHRSTGS